MDCYFISRCGHTGLTAPVQLVCDCLIAICPECAKRELLITFPSERQKKRIIPAQNEPEEVLYDAFLTCPECSSTISTTQHNIIHGVERSLQAEEELLRTAMTDVRKPYFKHTADLVVLESCWKALCEMFEPEESEFGDDLSLPDVSLPDATRAAKLRKKIAKLMLNECEGYDDPLDALWFTTNKTFEKYHLEHSIHTTNANATTTTSALTTTTSAATGTTNPKSAALWSDTECPLCSSTIQPGQSVQLTCACKQPVCRNCALINLHYSPQTYNRGAMCIMCRKHSPGTFQHTETIRECEDLLIKSARAYVTNKLLSFRDVNNQKSDENERLNLLSLVKMYWAVGYEGNLDMRSEPNSATATLPRLRLEVAKLEEMRLNSCGLLDTYSTCCGTSSTAGSAKGSANNQAGQFPISFLHALKVSKNTFFEHYYLKQSSVPNATTSIDTHAVLTQLRKLCSDDDRLDLLDKVILTCMQIQHFAQPSATVTYSTHTASSTSSQGCTIAQMVTMVLNYIKHPDLQFNTYLKTADVKEKRSEYFGALYKKITPQNLQACVRKFILNGFVTKDGCSQTDSKEELYVLSEASLKFALLDPHLLHTISEPVYFEEYSLLTPIISSSGSSNIVSAVVKTEGVYADTGDAIDYFGDAVTVTSRASASSTDSARNTSSSALLAPSRTTAKTGATGTPRTTNPTIISNANSTTSNITRAHTSTTSTTTNTPNAGTTTAAAGRKRGRPSILEKAIAQSFETCMSGGFYNSPPPAYTGTNTSAAVGSSTGKSSAKNGSTTTPLNTTNTSTTIPTNNGTTNTGNPPRSGSTSTSKSAGDEARVTKLKATKEAKANRVYSASAESTQRRYRLLHGGLGREYFEVPSAQTEHLSDTYTASDSSSDDSSYEGAGRGKKRAKKGTTSASAGNAGASIGTSTTGTSSAAAVTTSSSTSGSLSTTYKAASPRTSTITKPASPHSSATTTSANTSGTTSKASTTSRDANTSTSTSNPITNTNTNTTSNTNTNANANPASSSTNTTTSVRDPTRVGRIAYDSDSSDDEHNRSNRHAKNDVDGDGAGSESDSKSENDGAMSVGSVHVEDSGIDFSGSEDDEHSIFSANSAHSAASSSNNIADMIRTLKNTADEAFSDAARLREENKTLHHAISKARNDKVADLVAHKTQVKSLNEQIQSLSKQIKDKQRLIEDNEKAASEALEAMEAQRQAEVQKAEKGFAALNQELKKLKQDCDHYTAKIADTAKQLARKEQNAKDLISEIDKLKSANAHLKRDQKEFSLKFDEERKSHAAALDKKNAEYKALERDYAKKRDASEADLNLNGNLTRNYNNLLKRNQQLSEENETLRRLEQEWVAENAKLNKEASLLRRELNELTDKNTQQKEEIEELQSDVISLKKQRKDREEKEAQDNQEMASLFASIKHTS